MTSAINYVYYTFIMIKDFEDLWKEAIKQIESSRDYRNLPEYPTRRLCERVFKLGLDVGVGLSKVYYEAIIEALEMDPEEYN